ncbi:MAG: hypothetical protein V1839_04000 [archaeon]
MEILLDLKNIDWRLDDGLEKMVCDALALRLFSNSSHREIIVFNSEGINIRPGLISSSRLNLNDTLRLDVTDKNCAKLNYGNTTIRFYPKFPSNEEFHNYKEDHEIIAYLEKGAFLKGNADILAGYNIRLVQPPKL